MVHDLPQDIVVEEAEAVEAVVVVEEVVVEVEVAVDEVVVAGNTISLDHIYM